jgi:hypothetical protein
MADPFNPDVQMQDISRQRDLAKMLLQKGMTDNLQGQMVSGRYVGASPWEGIAKIYNAYKGGQLAREADTKQAQLAEMLRTEGDKDLMAYRQAVTPIPAVEAKPEFIPQGQTMLDDQGMPTMGYQAPVQAVPEKKADYDAGMSILRRSKDPETRQLAKMLMAEQIKTLVLPEGATAIRGSIGGSGQTIQGSEKVSPEIRTAAQMLGITGNPSTFTPQQTKLVADQVTANKKSGATNVNVNTANKFAGGFADKASGGAYNMYEAALSAPRQIENAKRTIELVNSGALTGPTADVALAAAKIFNVAGADNKDTISKTEQLFSNRGKAMLGSIKQSGLAGSQGLTEGERKFLTQAEGGTITLNAETLKAMAGLEIKMAVDNQKRWNTQAGKMDKEILNATGAGPVEVYTGIGTVDQSIVDKF